MGDYNQNLCFSKMRAKFASIYRCLAFVMKRTHSPRLTSPVVCGGGWLLALDHRRPVTQFAIHPGNNLRR